MPAPPKPFTHEDLQTCQPWVFPSFGTSAHHNALRALIDQTDVERQRKVEREIKEEQRLQAAHEQQQADLQNAWERHGATPSFQGMPEETMKVHQEAFTSGFNAAQGIEASHQKTVKRDDQQRLAALARAFHVAVGEDLFRRSVGPEAKAMKVLRVALEDDGFVQTMMAPLLKPMGWTIVQDVSLHQNTMAVGMPANQVTPAPVESVQAVTPASASPPATPSPATLAGHNASLQAIFEASHRHRLEQRRAGD